MLTPAQKTLHWREWKRVCDANHWREERGRLDERARERAGESLWHKCVWQLAGKLALQQHRSITAADLRHACCLVATTAVPGRPSARPVASLHDLTNWSFTRLLVLWSLLIDSDDLTAAADWECPERTQRETYLESLKASAPFAYVANISADRFGTRDWTGLGIEELRELAMKVRDRRRHWNEGVPA